MEIAGQTKLRHIELSPKLQEFLSTKKSRRTVYAYRRAFRHFINFYTQKHGKDATIQSFIERVFNDIEQPLRKRKRVAETELNNFVKYLQERKQSPNSIRVCVSTVRNYLNYHEIPLRMRFVAMPSAVVKEENEKHRWKIEQITSFVYAASTYRDKALILCLFQSGLSVNELINLDYRHVKENVESGDIPIMLRLVREKTNTPFVSFFGRDAVKYLKLYLETRKYLLDDTPLFTKWGSDTNRITLGAIEARFREIAEGLKFINNGNGGYNAARPHSLRAAFNSQLMGKIDGVLREFWMGHSIGRVAQAYLMMPDEEMKELYMDAEKYLAIERTSRDELIERKVVKIPPETEERIKHLEARLTKLSVENEQLSAEAEAQSNKFAEQEAMVREYLEKQDGEFAAFRERMERLQARLETLEGHAE